MPVEMFYYAKFECLAILLNQNYILFVNCTFGKTLKLLLTCNRSENPLKCQCAWNCDNQYKKDDSKLNIVCCAATERNRRLNFCMATISTILLANPAKCVKKHTLNTKNWIFKLHVQRWNFEKYNYRVQRMHRNQMV